MIRTIRHRGLRLLFERGDSRRIKADLRERVEDVLSLIDAANTVEAINLPGYRLHRLKGDLLGNWSVTVSGNWRIVFRFENGSAYDVDLVDYH